MLPEVEKKVEPQFEDFRKRMREKGYPEGLIEKAVERAKGYLEGVSRLANSRHPELVGRIQEEMVPEALAHSEDWIKGLYRVFVEKVRETIS